MKKIFLSILFCVVLVSCKQKVNNDNTENNLFESVFKVAGINDTVKANSVSMIIMLEGIESVYLNKSDSLVSVKADNSFIDQATIRNEIVKCGVEIIKEY